MRKLIYGINLTADGCCDHTQLSGSDEMHHYFTDLMDGVDLLLYGRKTYELMVPFWPDYIKTEVGPEPVMKFAKRFSEIGRVVVSTTLENVYQNTNIIRTNLAEEVLKLKREPGGIISTGGVSLPAQLLALGLVDEIYLLVHPVISGNGRRLVDGSNLQEQLKLELLDSRVLGSGSIALHYSVVK